MSSNDNENQQQEMILEWVNMEKNQSQSIIRDIKQLQDGVFIITFLRRIHKEMFEEFELVEFNLKVCLLEIQRYLGEHHGKKLKDLYKLDILERESYEMMAKLLLYIGVQSESKCEIVENIFTLMPETQNYLMKELKNVEKNIVDQMEIKEIMDKFRDLEEENEQLKERYHQISEQNKLIASYFEESQIQSKALHQENRKLKKQKRDIFEYLKLSDATEYLEVFKMLEGENDSLCSSLTKIESQKEVIESQNQQMLKKVKQDADLIVTLHQQNSQYKQAIAQLREEISYYESLQNNSLQNALKQNSNANNISKPRLSSDTNVTSGSILKYMDDENDEVENEKIKNLNIQLSQKYENVCKLNKDLCGELASFREDYSQLQRKCKRYKRRNAKLLDHLSLFSMDYELSISY